MVPGILRDQLIFKIKELPTWEVVKDSAWEHARLFTVYSNASSAHLAETHSLITHEFMERTESWEFADQIEELGTKGNSEVLLGPEVSREAWRQGNGARKPGGKGGGKVGGKGNMNGNMKGNRDQGRDVQEATVWDLPERAGILSAATAEKSGPSRN